MCVWGGGGGGVQGEVISAEEQFYSTEVCAGMVN